MRNGMASTDMEDGELLQGVARGDQDALLTLHKRYVNLVYSMAWRVLQDVGLAEEVTQDIFLKLWRKGRQYDPARGRFSSWLLSVTRFAAIDRLRREERQPSPANLAVGEQDETAALEQLLPTDHAAWERGQHLRLVLEQLPSEQRQIIELAYFGGLTHSELAEHLGLPLGTVKGRLRLGLEKLRALWLDETGKKHEAARPTY
ncbi:MAG: sigma-70 family RNA polymerase sigma factor [Anaerolineae bacterium]|nr:sigma-70 family RNA polymerase sigma factor [Anaerolineae bacterium]